MKIYTNGICRACVRSQGGAGKLDKQSQDGRAGMFGLLVWQADAPHPSGGSTPQLMEAYSWAGS